MEGMASSSCSFLTLQGRVAFISTPRRVCFSMPILMRRGVGIIRALKGEGEEEGQVKWDVGVNCVKPHFRVTPIPPPQDLAERKKVQILFLSEGNVCRSIYAEAIFTSMIMDAGLQGCIECSSKGVQNYNEGEQPDSRAVAVALEFGLQLRKDKVAEVFDCDQHINLFDLILVMDKFNASDVLKKITIHEAGYKEMPHTQKVRRLAEFCSGKMLEDIDDPLYGNMGGSEEQELLHIAFIDIRDSCKGLLKFLLEVQTNSSDPSCLRHGLTNALFNMKAVNWLVPPMLQT